MALSTIRQRDFPNGSANDREGAKLTMSDNLSVYLIDSDWRRRAALTSQLIRLDKHLEPFESIAEFCDHAPQGGLLLVHDEPGMIEALTDWMKQSNNWLPIICYAETPRTEQVVRSVMHGARDYLSLPITDRDILTAISTVTDNFSSDAHAWLRRSMAQSRIDQLTRREREVLEGVASGLSNRLIGEQLSISPRTVEIHRANMLCKLGARSTGEAIRVAVEALG